MLRITQFLLLSLFCLMVKDACAQNILSGRVVDGKGAGIYYATVAVFSSSDSSVVQSISTDEDGAFILKNLPDGEFYLYAAMLGFEDKKVSGVRLPNDNSTPVVINMVTDANMLDVVEITEKLPLMEQKADKLIINVEGNVTNTSGSLLDVMKKVPGMLVVNDRISLAGSGTPTILLNGKSTQYMDIQSLLKDMPGDNIKKVEIIHQPGAEYEASGSGPILNIIMKKNSLFGTNGSVHVGVGKGELWDYNTGINLSHYAGKVNISGGLGYSRNAWVEDLDLIRRLNNIDKQVDGIYTQSNHDPNTPNSYRGNIRIDYDLTKKHRIGFGAKLYSNTNERTAVNTTKVDLLDEETFDYNLRTENDRTSSWDYYSLNPYYIFEMDTSGQKLEFDLDVARYKVDGENTLNTSSSITSELDRQRYIQPGDTKIFASKLDYTKPISKSFELRIGGKYSYADLDNDLQSLYFEDNSWKNNVSQSNHYLFEETIYAGYGKINWNKGSWSGTAGLRYEKSNSEGMSVTIDSMLSRDISKLFPSFSVSKKINDVLTSTAAYSYRIDRPRYSTLNPFVYYIDPFTYETGNPTILPELTHSAKFTLSYEGQPFFNIEYKKSENAIVEITQQEDDSEEAFKTDVNFSNRSVFSTSLVFPLSFIKGLDGYGGVVVSKTMFDSPLEGATFRRDRWTPTAFIQIEFELPGEIDAEIGGWYQGRSQEGIFDAEYLYGTSAGISRKFLNKKLKVSLGVEDFAVRFWHARVDYQQDMDLVSSWQAPVVNFRLSYRFGNQFLNKKKRREGSASEEIRRATN